MAGSAASPQVQHKNYNVLCPAGTPLAAPLVSAIQLGDCLLHSVSVMVPSGPNGALGVALYYNNQLVVPFPAPVPSGLAQSPWLTLNDNTRTFDLETEIDTKLEVRSYNVGFWPHTSYWTFRLTPISATSLSTVQFVDFGA